MRIIFVIFYNASNTFPPYFFLYGHSLGLVKIYDIRGKLVAQFSLIEGSTNASIVECHFWGNGIAAMSSLSIVHVAEVSVWFP